MSYPYVVKCSKTYVFSFKYDGILCLRGEVSRDFSRGLFFLRGYFADSTLPGVYLLWGVIFRGYNQGKELTYTF